jgi:hypothetical protein
LYVAPDALRDKKTAAAAVHLAIAAPNFSGRKSNTATRHDCGRQRVSAIFTNIPFG